MLHDLAYWERNQDRLVELLWPPRRLLLRCALQPFITLTLTLTLRALTKRTGLPRFEQGEVVLATTQVAPYYKTKTYNMAHFVFEQCLERLPDVISPVTMALHGES